MASTKIRRGKHGVKFIDRDRGWEAMRKEIRKSIKEPHVVVGIYGSRALQKARKAAMTIAQLASVHEFGLTIQHPGGTAYILTEGGKAKSVSNKAAKGKNLPRTKPHPIVIPERSFIRGGVDANMRAIRKFGKRVATQVLLGKMTTQRALDTLGAFVHGKIIARINAGIPPALASSTIKRKKSSKPLIDTGQLKGSITWEVRNA